MNPHRRIDVENAPRDPLVITAATLAGQLDDDALSVPTADLERAIRAAGGAMMTAEGIGRGPWRASYRVEIEVRRSTQEIHLPVWPIERASVITPATGLTVSRIGGLDRSVVVLSACYCGTLVLDVWAGWLLDGEAKSWTPSSSYAVGDFVTSGLDRNRLHYEAVVAGTSGVAPPTWPTDGATVIDNEVTWTARAVEPMPFNLRAAAVLLARHFLDHDAAPADVASEAAHGFSLTYTQTDAALPLAAINLMAAYR